MAPPLSLRQRASKNWGKPNMRVRVIADKCEGHNRCCALAPELFDVDDYGMATALNEGEVPAELEDKAKLALENCPEYAIEIVSE
jgi:ferredoxin